MAQAPSSREDGGIAQERGARSTRCPFEWHRAHPHFSRQLMFPGSRKTRSQRGWMEVPGFCHPGTRVTLRPREIRRKGDPVMNETLGS